MHNKEEQEDKEEGEEEDTNFGLLPDPPGLDTDHSRGDLQKTGFRRRPLIQWLGKFSTWNWNGASVENMGSISLKLLGGKLAPKLV